MENSKRAQRIANDDHLRSHSGLDEWCTVRCARDNFLAPNITLRDVLARLGYLLKNADSIDLTNYASVCFWDARAFEQNQASPKSATSRLVVVRWQVGVCLCHRSSWSEAGTVRELEQHVGGRHASQTGMACPCPWVCGGACRRSSESWAYLPLSYMDPNPISGKSRPLVGTGYFISLSLAEQVP
jgi:hypothetical protein